MKSIRYCWANAIFSLLPTILWLYFLILMVNGQCPWPRTSLHVSLHSDCVCGYSNVRRLSVQCSPMANFSQLLEVLNSPSVQRLPIDLLYINNATGLSILPKNAFRKLDIQQIHLTNTYLDRIDKDAFAGLEDKLISLTLQNAGLKEIPAPIKMLRSLRTLDLSNNRIKRIRPRAFEDLSQLNTLRLAFNNDLQLDRDSFVGLGRTLKNLNLKGINLKHIPEAIFNLTELAFLDLAQNKIEEIKPRMFKNHHLLTALSLERNLIRSMHPDTFVGLNDSLSSLSLLNNMIIEFPLLALSKLTGLRVLDLGFNAIRQLPKQAFRSNELLTLLALDGNPIKTLSLQTFKHLNNSLRGLSVGGKYFDCDCKVKWLAEWALEYSLQITSRERNPQFCARPPHLRNKPFTHIDLDEFVCPPLATSETPLPPPMITIQVSTEKSNLNYHNNNASDMNTKETSSTTTTNASMDQFKLSSTTTTTAATILSTTASIATSTVPVNLATVTESSSTEIMKLPTGYVQVVPMSENDKMETTSTAVNKVANKMNKSTPTSTSKSNQIIGPASLKLIDAHYRNGSINLRWEPLKPNILGYQIIYRYFGSKEFFRTESLNSKVNSYTLNKFIAPNELIIVCVVTADDAEMFNYDEEGENIIPNGQCKELSTREPIIKKTMLNLPTRNTHSTSFSSIYPSLKRLNDIDKIVIGISAAVCVFIIVAVLIFSCCFYRSSTKDSPLRTLSTNAACLSNKSLSPLAKSGYDNEWETISVYSTRSIPRARITSPLSGQPLSGPPPLTTTTTDTLRSHVSGNNGFTHPVSRYIGSTLPPSQKTCAQTPWLDNYLTHYPSMNHLPAISYGTTVTAHGGLPFNHYTMDSFGLGSDSVTVERSKSNRFPNRTRLKSKSRQQPQQLQLRPTTLHQPHSKSHIDLRSNVSNGSSTNRLLSSSTSNSYHSQNDYDSDHWNGYGTQKPQQVPTLKNSYLHHAHNSNHQSLAAQTSAASTISRTMMNMNNDNEVDIYIDQNYAKRFY